MKWTQAALRRLFKPTRQRTVRNNRYVRPRLETLECRLAPANVSVLSFHNDAGLTGANLQETVLTPSNVNSNNFGKLAGVAVDGYVYASPLYVAGLMIGGTPHNVAYVGTENDSVYAFDVVNNSASPTGVSLNLLWQHAFYSGGPMGPITPGITSVPNSDVGTGDIVPTIGITGSPVIDATTNTLYVVAKTKEVRADGNHYVMTLHALDLVTGADKYITTGNGGYVVGDSKGDGFANQTTSIVVAGAGADTSGGANPQIAFNAFRENERSSLILLNGRVWVAWASHGDNGPYHGWVTGFNETTLQVEKWFNTSPNSRAGGIWQSEGAISTDGTFLYAVTGNTFNAGPNPGFDPTHGNYGETALKLDPSGPGTSITVASYFTPNEWQTLDNNDTDFGSGGLMLLPAAVGSTAHPNLGVAVGKSGKIYLLDTTPGHSMGLNVPAGQTDQVVQTITAGPGGVWGTPSFYQDGPNTGLIYYHGSGVDTRAFRITNGVITPASPVFDSNQNFLFPGAQPIISANGAQNGSSAIDWELDVGNYGSQGLATLHAYVADPATGNVLTELYNSNQTGARDQFGGSVKFTSATETNAMVFVGSEFNFSVFGLFPTHTAVPGVPTNLSGMGTSPTAITLSWTSPNPNTATGIKIFRSVGTDTNFTLLTTAPSFATSYTDTGLTSGQIYFYKIAATNQAGDSAQTAEIQTTTLLAPPVTTTTNVTSVSVALQWTKPPVANDHYSIERSTTATFASFTTIASNIAGSTLTFTDTDTLLVSQPGQYFYRVRAFSNPAGTTSVASNVVGVKVGPAAGVINYGPPNGFPTPPAPAPFDVQANGSAQFAETTLRLTNAINQTGSGFSTSEENILNWTTTFAVRLHEGTQPNYANGFTFVIQAIGANAVGQGLTGLGYQGITNSVALTFDTFTNGFFQNGGGGSVGLYINGHSPGGTPGTGETRIALDPTMVNLNSQSSKVITLSYAYNASNPGASVLHEVVTDPDHPTTPFTHDYTVDIPSLLGSAQSGNTIAYVGFTGSTGTQNFWELQDILNWVYTPTGPAAPHGLTALSTATTNILNWKTTSADDGPAPAGYYIERSTSQTTGFTRVATLAPGTSTYTDANLTNPQQYYYRVQQFNHNGSGGAELDSGYSNVATGAAINVNFNSFPNGNGFTTNIFPGETTVNSFPGTPPVLRLTDGNANEATAVWYNTAIGTGAFTTTFTLRDTSPSATNAADSLLFVIQNDPGGATGGGAGLSAVGHGGGAGGYGPDDSLNPPMILNSIGLKFDLYSGGSHNPTTGFFMNGQYPGTAHNNGADVPLTGINLDSGDPMTVTITYDGSTTLTETVTDTVTNATFSHGYTMPMTLAQIVGTTGYAGFTGGTGGQVATQDILSWSGQFAQAPPVVNHFTVSANPGSITAGGTTQVTVSAFDQYGNLFPSYGGTVHFTSNDPQVSAGSGLPANYTFTTADMGTHTFAVTLKTAGSDTVTATDTAKASVTGTGSVSVSPGATAGLALTGIPPAVTQGTANSFTVSAVDTFGNTTPGYLGTVKFTSSDGMANLPGNYPFVAADNGTHTFSVTFNTTGPQSITVTDTVNASFTATASTSVQQAGVVIINLPNFNSTANLTANGNTTFVGTPAVARLTNGGASQASSLFYDTPVGSGAFSTSFTLRDTGNPSADSLSFVMQNDPRGLSALGNGGGNGGYGDTSSASGPLKITKSIAIKFDIWTNNTHVPTTGLFINGQSPATSDQNPVGSQDINLPDDILRSGDPLQVMITYDGSSNLTEMVTDPVKMLTFSHTYTNVNLAQLFGGNAAYVGFTAGTGGATAIQDIVSWTGTFQQADTVVLNFPNFANNSNLTANTSINPPSSTPINVFPPTPGAVLLAFDPNFNNHTGLVTNGNATFTGTPTAMQLTDGGGSEAGSVWYSTPVFAGSFDTSFVLQDLPPFNLGGADSLSFVMQADPRGTAALGAGGGGGGYQGIAKSIAVKFDIWTNNTHVPTTGLFFNGQSPATSDQNPQGSQDIALPDDILRSGDPLVVHLTYNGTTLTETVLDTNTLAMFSHIYTVNLAQFLGYGPALVGFTAGTGGATATQKILRWTGSFSGAPTAMQLTDNRGGEATSVFDNTEVGLLGPFTTTFTLLDTPTQSADSLSYVMQADPRGTTALGAGGGGGGYQGISNSIAIKFDLYTNGTHTPTTGLYMNGQSPASPNPNDITLTGFPDLGSGHPITVTIQYNGGNQLTEMVTDTVAHVNFTHTYTINLAQVMGANSAYVGFTAGTGGVSSTQTIQNWAGTFAPAQPTKFVVSAPASAPAGTPFQVTVTAVDRNNNLIPGYFGTIHFASSDPAAVLPANYLFAIADNGTRTFTATLNTTGAQTLTVSDTNLPSLNGTVSVNGTLDYSNGFANHNDLMANSSAKFVSNVGLGPVGIFAGNQDLGTPGDPAPAGTASFSNGTYTLTSSGSDIWANSDHFHYVYEPLTGDGTIIARVVNPEVAQDYWTKAGVMIRQDLNAGSPNEFMMYTPYTGNNPNPHQEPVQQWRDVYNPSSTQYGDTGNHPPNNGNFGQPVPIWLRLVRLGNNFSGYWAVDVNGAPGAWNLMTTHTTVMPTTVFVGLALTAHNNGAVATATFDHVQVIGATSTLTPTTVARITDGGGTEAGSVFTKTKVTDTSFTTTFTFQANAVSGSGDSLLFVLQNDPRGAAAVGRAGGGGGYDGIANSIGVKFDFYSHGAHNALTGLFVNGQLPDSGGLLGGDVTVPNINFASGDPIKVTLIYNGTTLTENILDTVTGVTFTHDYLVNISQIVGGNAAYAGFTGGTGGDTAVQDILSWTYQPIPVPAVASLTVSVATSPNLVNNGGFETGDFTGWTLSGDRGDDGIVTGPADNVKVHSGTHAAHAGPNNLVFLTQTLATTAGASYNLDFWLSNPVDGGGTEWLVKVGATGTTLTTLMDVHNAPRFNYTHFTFTFTASSSSTDLQFGLANPPDEFYLDDVSVTPTALSAGANAFATVTALDAGGHQVAYTGTVHITSTDPQIPVFGDYTFTAADNGQHVFTGTLLTAGTQTVTFRDVNNSSLVASANQVVVPAATNSLLVTQFPSQIGSGAPAGFLVTAKDPFGNTTTAYRGTVNVTSSDPKAAFDPTSYTFTAADNGQHAFSAILRTLGTQTVTATDAANSAIKGSQSVVVTPASFQVTGFPSEVTAGDTDSFTVSALDFFGNGLPTFLGTVHLTSSDPKAVFTDDDGTPLPGNNYTFTTTDQGIHTFLASLVTAGTQSITVSQTDVPNSHATGTQSGIKVDPAATSTFTITGYPSPITAGTPGTFTVTAQDAFGNKTPAYTGTVTFSSSDPLAVFNPTSYTFLSSDNGVHTFTNGATLKTTGVQTLTATDSTGFSGQSAGIVVNPAATSQLVITSAYPSPVTAGTANTITITAEDALGNTVTGYRGTVHVSTNDPQLTAFDYTFTAGDNGVHTFSLALKTAGTTQSITVKDNANASLTATQSGIEVDPASATKLLVNGFPATSTAGMANSVTVTAEDPFNNVDTNYAGTVHLSSDDPQAAFDPDYTFSSADAGKHTFGATLFTAGTHSITATDTVTGSITGAQTGLVVNPAAASQIVVTTPYPSPVTAGTAHNATVTVEDAFGNTVTGYRGTMHVSSSDGQLAPFNYAFTAADNGVHTFSITLKTAGSQSLFFSDTTANITGEQDGITVNEAAFAGFKVTGYPSPVSADTLNAFTVAAVDAFGNTVLDYHGTAIFSSDDSGAVFTDSDGTPLSSNSYTFTAGDAGTHTFQASFHATGTHHLRVIDAVFTNLFGEQDGIVVQ
jgi:hypothetical protein